MERDRLPGCKSCERAWWYQLQGNGILLLLLNSLVPGINFCLVRDRVLAVIRWDSLGCEPEGDRTQNSHLCPAYPLCTQKSSLSLAGSCCLCSYRQLCRVAPAWLSKSEEHLFSHIPKWRKSPLLSLGQSKPSSTLANATADCSKGLFAFLGEINCAFYLLT